MSILSPVFDMQLMLAMLFVCGFVSLAIGFFIKRKIWALATFSVLANLVLLFFVLLGSEMFYFYNIIWFRTFSFFVWPVLNVYFINKLISKK